ncbi:hypothetical protein EJ04DRAFT_573328 [Polyplosphaeria fusca]|uniref:CENP-V/GFA domain-containing protein n=1 Tax=Polyplosphaeria fusca TaxID=682080 RepID=A0A9P4V8C3_9PLEO|nr:hypothetical protein EJ04DRAFT_573328 [Polyplosphaeria fusca]
MSSEADAASPSKPSETYHGSCHCGRFSYAVTYSPPLSDPDASVVECNCSICARNGYLLIYVDVSHINYEKGVFDELKKYTFANHEIAHYFCPTCGTSCFAKATATEGPYANMQAVNVRTFQGLELKSLNLKEVDGKSR